MTPVQSELLTLQVPVDGEITPVCVSTIIFRYFIVPQSTQYVLNVIVRTKDMESADATAILPEPDDFASVLVLVTSTGNERVEKRGRVPTFT